MATLLFRDITHLWLPPLRRQFPYKDIRVNSRTYRVYVDGAVWSFDTGAWQRQDIDRDGYRVVCLGNRKTKVHRLVLMVFDRAPTYGEEARHLDGDPSNNHRDNLAWGTGKQNWQDRRDHGREGAEWRRLLTPAQALAIYNDPRPERDIAKEYGIQRLCVCLIKEKRTYKEIHNAHH